MYRDSPEVQDKIGIVEIEEMSKDSMHVKHPVAYVNFVFFCVPTKQMATIIHRLHVIDSGGF